VGLGKSGNGINLADGVRFARFPSSPSRPGASVLSIYEDGAGHLWTGTSAGLTLHRGDHVTEVLTATGERLEHVWNISGDSAGNIWLSDQFRGLFHIGAESTRAMRVDVTNSQDVDRLVFTPDGDIWLGHYKGGITVLHQGTARHYADSDGISGGVRALYADDSGTIWVGTVNGLSRYQNGRWTTWTKSRGLPEASIDAIAMDNRNGLWLISAGDLIRVDLASLHESGPVAQLSYTRTDGLRLINGSISSSPIIIRGRQGRMWVATMDGAAVFDPARLIRNRVPPPVVIEQVTVDGQALDIASGEVHYRGRNLQITYTGLSLTAAERAGFRYRMNGVDQDWTDAAARRAVAYVDLKPGSYRFQVAAANNDGVWNEQGSSVAIVVDPYFYQTTWFAAICVGIALAIAWGIHQIRVRQVVTRLQVIAAERARFSRELHD